MRVFKSLIVAMLLCLSPMQAGAATILGEFWDANINLWNLSRADAVIAAGGPDATFESTGIDYPNNSNNMSSNGTLAAFLGTDADSLTGEADTRLVRSVFRFSGYLDLAAGPQTFRVASDDGFRLTIDGEVVSQHTGRRGFRSTSVTTDAGTGNVDFELIFFEHTGATGVEFTIDGQVATAAVPLPTAGLLLATGFIGLIGLRRRKSA